MLHTPSVTLGDTLQGLKTMNFIPHNALEEQLAAVHAGSLEAENFVLRLLDQQLFMAVACRLRSIPAGISAWISTPT